MKTTKIDDVGIRLPIEGQDHIDIHKKRLSSGQFVVAYAAHDNGCENPIESCDGMGKIIEHHRQSHADETSEMLESNPLVVPLSKFEHGQVLWGVMGSLSGTPDFRWDGTSYAGRWEPDSSCIEHIKSSAIKKLLPEGVNVEYKSKYNPDGTSITRPPKPGETPYLTSGQMVDERYSNVITLTMPGFERGGYASFKSAYMAAARRLKIKVDPQLIKKAERELAIECAAQACKVYTAWCNGESYGWVCAWFDKDGKEIDHDSVWGYCDGDTKYLEEEILSNFESKCKKLEKINVETQLAECVP